MLSDKLSMGENSYKKSVLIRGHNVHQDCIFLYRKSCFARTQVSIQNEGFSIIYKFNLLFRSHKRKKHESFLFSFFQSLFLALLPHSNKVLGLNPPSSQGRLMCRLHVPVWLRGFSGHFDSALQRHAVSGDGLIGYSRFFVFLTVLALQQKCTNNCFFQPISVLYMLYICLHCIIMKYYMC